MTPYWYDVTSTFHVAGRMIVDFESQVVLDSVDPFYRKLVGFRVADVSTGYVMAADAPLTTQEKYDYRQPPQEIKHT